MKKEITLPENVTVETITAELKSAHNEGFDGYRIFVHFGPKKWEFAGQGFKGLGEQVFRAIQRTRKNLQSEALAA
jgi:phosphotransferase system IIA component